MKRLPISVLTEEQRNDGVFWDYALVTHTDGDDFVEVVYYIDDIRLCELITDPMYALVEL